MYKFRKNSLINWQISNIFLVILLAVAVFAVYANTFGNGMFWDDNDFILNNIYIKSWQYIPQWFSQNIISGAGLGSNYWRPALLAVFSLEWHFWQDWSPGYHIVNVCFHLANGILLFYIFNGIFRRRGLAFVAALVFLLHPVQTEAVSYANSLGDSLSAFFMFLGLWLFLSAIQNSTRPFYMNWRYYAAVFTYPLALMSKETAIIMPALAALVWFFVSSGDIPSASDLSASALAKADGSLNAAPLTKFKRLFGRPASNSVVLAHVESTRVGQVSLRTMPKKIIVFGTKFLETLGLFLGIAAAYIFLRATILNFGGTFNLYQQANVFSTHMLVRILTFFRIFTIYLGLIFWPAHLHMERNVEWAMNIVHWDVVAGAVIFILAAAAAFWQLPRRNPLSFGLFWFLIGLAPTSNIAVPINGLLYEHWLYLPLAGFALAFLEGCWLALKKICKDYYLAYFIAGAAVVIISAAMAARTIVRNFDWRDPVTFYSKTLAFAPNDYRLLNNLGMEYAARQDFINAAKYYNLAITSQEEMAVAYYNLGNLLLAQNKVQEALEKYIRALELDPKFLYAYSPVIKIYSQEGNFELAQKYYQQYDNITK